MNKMIPIHTLILFISLLCNSCDNGATSTINNEKKEFTSSFESVNDFDGFYITPQNHLGTTSHELSKDNVYSGVYAHKAWINGANSASTTSTNNNHRGYPTIQLQNSTQGVFSTPCYITLWVWLDMELNKNTTTEDDWFSFATFTDDESDNWSRTVLVNLSADGFVHLQHTTNQGEQTSIFQTTEITYPQKQWVELKMFLDFGTNGYAKVWQDGQLVSHAEIGNITNQLSQAHFGLYCSPQIASGTVYNDNLTIREVDKE